MSLSQALGVESAVFSAASIDASASDALIAISAVVVSFALSLIANDRFAVSVCVSDLIDWTFADQSSQWNRIHHTASLIAAADVSTDARILAVLVDTSELRCALRIDGTFRSWRGLLDQALNVRIAHGSIAAET